jgi:hypothetical protein
MCGDSDDGFQAVIPKSWNTINEAHLREITANWRQSQVATRSGDSILQYDLHRILSLSPQGYVCIAARGGDNAQHDLRYVYQFKLNDADNSFDLYWAGRCPGHEYNNPRSIGFPADTYRIAAPAPDPVPAAAAPTPGPAPAAPQIPPVAQRTFAEKIKYGFQ